MIMLDADFSVIGRDYLVGVPDGTYQYMLQCPVAAPELAAMSKSLLLELAVPVLDVFGQWVASDCQQVKPPGHLHWTEQSERHLLDSVTATRS